MKVLLTGSTPVQVGSTRTQLGILTAARAWHAVLLDLKHEVEWRPVTPGEDLRGYDRVIVVLNKPNSIASSHLWGAIWVLSQRPDAVVTVDDWQTVELVTGLETFARSEARAFKLRGGNLPPATRGAVFEQLQRMAGPPWPWPIVAPVHGDGGDQRLLKLPGRVIAVDPTSYLPRYPLPSPPPKRQKRWVQASLSAKDVSYEKLKWEVVELGPLNRSGVGGIGSIGPAAKPRVPEAELTNVYAASRGVLSPPHYHAGSGWFRVRFLMAADAGCVLAADPREAATLGQPYLDAADPAKVERLVNPQLDALAAAQADRLRELTWPRERVRGVWQKLLRRRS